MIMKRSDEIHFINDKTHHDVTRIKVSSRLYWKIIIVMMLNFWLLMRPTHHAIGYPLSIIVHGRR